MVESSKDLVAAALSLVLEHGHAVAGERGSREVLNAQLVLVDPAARLLPPGWTTYNLTVAVARLVWHLGASSELDAIAFYEPRVRAFSDDGRVVSGSNVGARLFGPVPAGIDQFQAALGRLRLDQTSRRASAVIWRPLDSTRDSRDIPCAFGISFHVRGGCLITTTSMRSNNALRLLPYNAFENSMIGELAATLLGVPLGPYVHLAQSLHVFQDEADCAQKTLAKADGIGVIGSMPPMPAHPDPMKQVGRLVDLERRLRGASLNGAPQEFERLLERSRVDLDPYWFAFLAVLFFATGPSYLRVAVVRALNEVSPSHPFLDYMPARRRASVEPSEARTTLAR